MSSIRGRLLAWLLSAVALVGVAAAGITYLRALQDLDALFDYQLQQLAFSLTRSALGSGAPNAGGADTEPDFITQVWDKKGVLQFYSRPSMDLPRRPEPGFSTVHWKGQVWRVFTAVEGARTFQVAHPLSLRRDMAADLARRSIVPLLSLLPVLAVLIWVGVGRSLSPLEAMSRSLRTRGVSSLEPLPVVAPLPDEVRPLVDSLNDLLVRLGRALELQRQFVADAAHELRTPLTAVGLQVQLVQRAQEAGARDEALARLREGVARCSRLVNQLLALARQEPGATARPGEPVDLAALLQEQAGVLQPLARERGITLAVDAAPCSLPGDRIALGVMLANLMDNAVRYTPAAGQVVVHLQHAEGLARIVVEDSGPGIAPEQRSRVFDRFYRVPGNPVVGSGLGLAIVKRVVGLHGGAIALDASPLGGLQVQVSLPGAQPRPPVAGDPAPDQSNSSMAPLLPAPSDRR